MKFVTDTHLPTYTGYFRNDLSGVQASIRASQIYFTDSIYYFLFGM